MQTDKFVNRDVSWLEFNGRVLEEALDPKTPLMEKLKFLSIFSSNLDEFCMVRIAGITYGGLADSVPLPRAGALLAQLRTRLLELVERQYNYLQKEILPALEEHGICLRPRADLKPKYCKKLDERFNDEILHVLTPIGLPAGKPLPEIPNLSLMLFVRLRHGSDEHYAMVEVPPNIPRFIRLKSAKRKKQYFVPLEEVISANIGTLFAGCEILETGVFRITRDMNFALESEPMDELISELHTVFQSKSSRSVIRLEIDEGMSAPMQQFLMEKLQIQEQQAFLVHGLPDLTSLAELTEHCSDPTLFDNPMPPLPSCHFSPDKSMFQQIARLHHALLHVPYESFDPVLTLLEEAASDPDVLAIKQTIYRAGKKSPVIQALRKAAENGKKVTVLFEIKARFDEENNMQYGTELAEAGVNVLYGISGLKVHCKALLIVRREGKGVRRYVHMSTGNYNAKTARQYTDIGYFTDDADIADDVAGLFNVITGISDPPEWKRLLVAPNTLRSKIIEKIDREAALSVQGKPGSIRIKANALLDFEVIEHLYSAACKGVQIGLVIRGICALNPDTLPPEQAKNIRLVSILDRFLEHSRIYIFGNGGNPEYYAGSADLMPRNLDRRIEVLFPVERKSLCAELDKIMQTALNDRRKGRVLIGENSYTSTCNGDLDKFEKTRSQYALYEYYRKRLHTKMKGFTAEK